MENEKHHKKQQTNSWMIISLILLIVALAEGYYIYHQQKQSPAMMLPANNANIRQQSQTGGRPKPMFILKGQKFSESPLFSKAYLIFPVSGNLSANAQKALTGWEVKTTANTDGSTQVDLVPKEAEDVKQSFTVKAGYKLYFIEMTLSDDQTGVDENRGDDIGVLIDQNGIIQ